MKLIAISGGIGSGKSVVARVVQVMGCPVYDCDSRARSLMAGDEQVRRQLVEAFGAAVYHADGSLDRGRLAAVAFDDADALSRLNGIVHPATVRDMQRWAGEQAAMGVRMAFVETAILRTAGLQCHVDAVWHVTAPPDIRIQRVMARSGLTADQVRDRMTAQIAEEEIADGECVIINDGIQALLPQVIRLLNTDY